MGEYRSLERTVMRLKRAAIDAYMHGRGFSVGLHTYSMTGRVTSSGPDVTLEITRPDAVGEGGGSRTDGGQGAFFEGEFDAIRCKVDELAAPWWNLPDPIALATEVDKCRAVTSSLTLSASANGSTYTQSLLTGDLDAIKQRTTAMSGSIIRTFEMKFLNNLVVVVNNLQAVSILTGATIRAEEGLWTDARDAVATAFEHATNQLEVLATRNSSASPAMILKILGWAVGGILAFATGGMAHTFNLVALGIEVAESSVPESKPLPEVEASNYDSVLAGLGERLFRIDADITKVENELVSNIATATEHITRKSDTGSDAFDLRLPGISTTDGIIVINEELVKDILELMPSAARRLSDTAADVTAATLSVPRDGAIGIGTDGPTAQWQSLSNLLRDLLSDLAWELQQGAKNLELAVAALRTHDKQIQDQLRKIGAEIDAHKQPLPHS